MPALGHTSPSTTQVERKAFARAPHRSPQSYSDEVCGQKSHVVARLGQGDRADGKIVSVLPDSKRLSSSCSSTSLDMAIAAMATTSNVPCRCGCLFQSLKASENDGRSLFCRLSSYISPHLSYNLSLHHWCSSLPPPHGKRFAHTLD